LASILLAYCVESFGGVSGSILGTVPSTVVVAVVALFFLESRELLLGTLEAVPIGMLNTFLVLLMWRFLPRLISRPEFTKHLKLVTILILSVLLWVGLSVGEVPLIEFLSNRYKKNPNALSVYVVSTIFLCVYFVLAVALVVFTDFPLGRKGDEVVGWKTHAARFVVGALANVAVVLLAQLNEYISGIIITFPAVIFSALCSLWLTHSETVAVGAVVPMILGSASTSIFSLVFVWAFPHIEKSFIGTLGSVFVTLFATWFLVFYCYSIPIAVLLRKKELTAMETVPHILLFDDSFRTSTIDGVGDLDMQSKEEDHKGALQDLC